MNLLAHAYLSFNNPPVLVGNMISDYVKGKKKFLYDPAIQKGIELHRVVWLEANWKFLITQHVWFMKQKLKTATPKLISRQRTAQAGRDESWKKAIVTLKEGDKIILT